MLSGMEEVFREMLSWRTRSPWLSIESVDGANKLRAAFELQPRYAQNFCISLPKSGNEC